MSERFMRTKVYRKFGGCKTSPLRPHRICELIVLPRYAMCDLFAATHSDDFVIPSAARNRYA